MKFCNIYPQFTDACTKLYTDAFPEIERREISAWLDYMQTKENFKAQAIIHDETLVGFITSWHFADFGYGEHFAICSEMRNGGIGGKAFDLFLEANKNKNVVIEVELPEDEMARRRIGFYERHQMTLIDKEYLQPPYQPGFDFLPLRLMATNPEETLKNFDHIQQAIHREVYGVQ